MPDVCIDNEANLYVALMASSQHHVFLADMILRFGLPVANVEADRSMTADPFCCLSNGGACFLSTRALEGDALAALVRSELWVPCDGGM